MVVGKRREKNYIYPLVRYFLRDLLWKTGEGECFSIDLENSNKNSSYFDTQIYSLQYIIFF
jgi:hypothetical protein